MRKLVEEITAVVTAAVDTQFGSLAIVADADTNEVLSAGFDPVATRLAKLGIAGEDRRVRPASANEVMPARDAVLAWASGQLTALDGVKVRQSGGEFWELVWEKMRLIPPGSTWSYSKLAAEAGRPAAVRAVGSACAQNLVPPFVPCHRVVSASGALGGYYWGRALKEAILRHEGAQLTVQKEGKLN